MLPINMEDSGINISIIGLVMSGYSLGILFGGNYSQKIISRVGHNRSFAAVAALISCVAVLHIYIHNPIVLSLLRLLVGLAMAVIYITLESWLNATSDNQSRGVIYALYQIFAALGLFLSPLCIAFIDPLEPSSFALVALFLSFSLIPIALTRFKTPELVENQKRLSIIEMLRDTPSSCITVIVAGLSISTLYIFTSIYAIWLGFDTIQMAFLVATATGSSVFFQIPVGRLADKFDQRKVIFIVSLIALVFSFITYVMSSMDIDWKYYLLTIFFVGGCFSCLYPLAVHFIFSQIDNTKAVPAMSSLLILNSIGLIFGPIICSFLMNFSDTSALFIYLAVLAALLAFFMSYRVYIAKRKITDIETIPYSIGFQMLYPNFGLNPISPAIENSINRSNNPIITTLASSIAISPKKTKQLIQANLEHLSHYETGEIVLSLVLHKPRRTQEIVEAFVEIYPEKVIEFVFALKDLIALNKTTINGLIKNGLQKKSDTQTMIKVDELFTEFLTSELQ